MALVLDTGGLVGFERGDRQVAARVEAARRRHDRLVTSSGCVAQAWRGAGSRQAVLARLLAGLKEEGFDQEVSRPVGELCGKAGTSDVVDAHVALVTSDGDTVLTSDDADIRRLLRTRGVRAQVRHC